MKSVWLKLTALGLTLTLMFLSGCSSENVNNIPAADGTTTAAADDNHDHEHETNEDGSVKVPPTPMGEGETNFLVDLTYDDKTIHFTAWTNKTTVGEALLEMQFISGEDTEYGLNVTIVNGISADYEKDKAYWAFYVNGEYASTGVMDTKIVAGDTYAFVKTPA
jgi:hypothetical protein